MEERIDFLKKWPYLSEISRQEVCSGYIRYCLSNPTLVVKLPAYIQVLFKQTTPLRVVSLIDGECR